MTGTLAITGANGFVGSHLAALAQEAGHTVIGIGREPSPDDSVARSLDRYLSADLYQTWPLTEEVDAIVHLAGLAAVGPSFREPQRYISINSGIITRMGETLLAEGRRPRIVVVSSGAVYAPPANATPVTESSPVTYTSPYVVAKLLVESQARYYATRGLDTVIVRPFNHIGPGQSHGFLIPDLISAVRDIAEDDSIAVGNLDTARDFTDVRDVARAYLELAFAPDHEHDVYNVATGSARTGRDALTAIARALGRAVPRTSVDLARLRPNDPPVIIGDSTRLRDEYGWTPTVPWAHSIADRVGNADGSVDSETALI